MPAISTPAESAVAMPAVVVVSRWSSSSYSEDRSAENVTMLVTVSTPLKRTMRRMLIRVRSGRFRHQRALSTPRP
ncbi:hypothetical protein ACRJ4W_22925 [Streptomyces sp. GLT-R25]